MNKDIKTAAGLGEERLPSGPVLPRGVGLAGLWIYSPQRGHGVTALILRVVVTGTVELWGVGRAGLGQHLGAAKK